MNTTNPESASKEPKLSAPQVRVLTAAAAHPRGIVEPTSNLKERVGHIRTIDALARQSLIRQLLPPDDEAAPGESSPGASTWMVTAAGLRAIGAPDVMLSGGSSPGSKSGSDSPVSVDSSAAEAAQQTEEPAKSKRGKTTRDASGASGNKSELLLGLLRREEGASLEALIDASGWQAHSVRGFLSGTVRKRLGLTLVSEKDEAGARRYCIET